MPVHRIGPCWDTVAHVQPRYFRRPATRDLFRSAIPHQLSIILPGDRYILPILAMLHFRRTVGETLAIGRYQSVVQTDYHQFTIEAGPPRELIHGHDPLFPLALFAGDILRVNVGIRSGPVNVTVELHD
jgi:hypothetical protein